MEERSDELIYTDGAKLVLGNPVPNRFEFALGFSHGWREQKSSKEIEEKERRENTEVSENVRMAKKQQREICIYCQMKGRKVEFAKRLKICGRRAGENKSKTTQLNSKPQIININKFMFFTLSF